MSEYGTQLREGGGPEWDFEQDRNPESGTFGAGTITQPAVSSERIAQLVDTLGLALRVGADQAGDGPEADVITYADRWLRDTSSMTYGAVLNVLELADAQDGIDWAHSLIGPQTPQFDVRHIGGWANPFSAVMDYGTAVWDVTGAPWLRLAQGKPTETFGHDLSRAWQHATQADTRLYGYGGNPYGNKAANVLGVHSPLDALWAALDVVDIASLRWGGAIIAPVRQMLREAAERGGRREIADAIALQSRSIRSPDRFGPEHDIPLADTLDQLRPDRFGPEYDIPIVEMFARGRAEARTWFDNLSDKDQAAAIVEWEKSSKPHYTDPDHVFDPADDYDVRNAYTAARRARETEMRTIPIIRALNDYDGMFFEPDQGTRLYKEFKAHMDAHDGPPPDRYPVNAEDISEDLTVYPTARGNLAATELTDDELAEALHTQYERMEFNEWSGTDIPSDENPNDLLSEIYRRFASKDTPTADTEMRTMWDNISTGEREVIEADYRAAMPTFPEGIDPDPADMMRWYEQQGPPGTPGWRSELDADEIQRRNAETLRRYEEAEGVSIVDVTVDEEGHLIPIDDEGNPLRPGDEWVPREARFTQKDADAIKEMLEGLPGTPTKDPERLASVIRNDDDLDLFEYWKAVADESGYTDSIIDSEAWKDDLWNDDLVDSAENLYAYLREKTSPTQQYFQTPEMHQIFQDIRDFASKRLDDLERQQGPPGTPTETQAERMARLGITDEDVVADWQQWWEDHPGEEAGFWDDYFGEGPPGTPRGPIDPATGKPTAAYEGPQIPPEERPYGIDDYYEKSDEEIMQEMFDADAIGVDKDGRFIYDVEEMERLYGPADVTDIPTAGRYSVDEIDEIVRNNGPTDEEIRAFYENREGPPSGPVSGGAVTVDPHDELLVWSHPLPLVKIISGGQTGADIAGLSAGKELGLEVGGVAPRGYRTDVGSNYDLRDLYGVTEHTSASYSPRTLENIRNSDGTIIFDFTRYSRGSDETRDMALRQNKPLLDIRSADDIDPVAIRAWIINENIRVLNVAGNRESSTRGINQIVHDALTEMAGPPPPSLGFDVGPPRARPVVGESPAEVNFSLMTLTERKQVLEQSLKDLDTLPDQYFKSRKEGGFGTRQGIAKKRKDLQDAIKEIDVRLAAEQELKESLVQGTASGTIVHFERRQNSILSPLAETPFRFRGAEFRTAEGAYQAYKSGAKRDGYEILTGPEAKKKGYGQWVNRRTNLDLMREILAEKYRQVPEFRDALNAAEGQITHPVSDVFWKDKLPMLLDELRTPTAGSSAAAPPAVNDLPVPEEYLGDLGALHEKGTGELIIANPTVGDLVAKADELEGEFWAKIEPGLESVNKIHADDSLIGIDPNESAGYIYVSVRGGGSQSIFRQLANQGEVLIPEVVSGKGWFAAGEAGDDLWEAYVDDFLTRYPDQDPIIFLSREVEEGVWAPLRESGIQWSHLDAVGLSVREWLDGYALRKTARKVMDDVSAAPSAAAPPAAPLHFANRPKTGEAWWTENPELGRVIDEHTVAPVPTEDPKRLASVIGNDANLDLFEYWLVVADESGFTSSLIGSKEWKGKTLDRLKTHMSSHETFAEIRDFASKRLDDLEAASPPAAQTKEGFEREALETFEKTNPPVIPPHIQAEDIRAVQKDLRGYVSPQSTPELAADYYSRLVEVIDYRNEVFPLPGHTTEAESVHEMLTGMAYVMTAPPRAKPYPPWPRAQAKVEMLKLTRDIDAAVDSQLARLDSMEGGRIDIDAKEAQYREAAEEASQQEIEPEEFLDEYIDESGPEMD